MQAQIFEELCKAVWEHGPEVTIMSEHGMITTSATWELAAPFGGVRKSFPQAGVDVILFPDGSGALCGTRGASVLAVWDRADHGDPEMDEERMSWDLGD